MDLKKKNQQVEIWKPVVGYEGLYEVSSFGRVRSMRRTIYVKASNWRDAHKAVISARILKPRQDGGRNSVSLSKNNSIANFLVYHLVLNAFVGPRPEGYEARHFPDRNPKNDALENLSWATKKVNQGDRKLHGTSSRGEWHGRAVFTWELVCKIRSMYQGGGWTYKKLGKEFGVGGSHIGQIIRGELWRTKDGSAN